MKKKLIAAILTGAILAAGMSVSVWADGEKSFVYGTTGYSEEMGDAGLNPHDNYSGWSALVYGVGETFFKYNDNMEVEPWFATDYEFVDDPDCKDHSFVDGEQFSSGRTMDAEAVKECLEHLIAVHDRAPYDLQDRPYRCGRTDTYHLYDRAMSGNHRLPWRSVWCDHRYGVRRPGRRRFCECGRNRPVYCRECYSNPDRSGQK